MSTSLIYTFIYTWDMHEDSCSFSARLELIDEYQFDYNCP